LPLVPHYQPYFSSKEIEQAQRIVRKHTAGQTLVLRARLVLLLADNPALSSPECAKQLAVHQQTVRKWRKRWATEEFTLSDKPRSGRRWDFSPSTQGSSQSNCL